MPLYNWNNVECGVKHHNLPYPSKINKVNLGQNKVYIKQVIQKTLSEHRLSLTCKLVFLCMHDVWWPN